MPVVAKLNGDLQKCRKNIEDQITAKIGELKSATNKAKIIAELNLLLDERNRKIKILK